MASARHSVAKAWRKRTVSLSVSPPPVSFAERRSILQVLEQHGAVDFFKPVAGHDTMFVSVMREESTVEKLVAASPLTYAISIPKSGRKTFVADLSAPAYFPKTQLTLKSPEEASKHVADPAGDGSELKDFKINVFPKTDYHHDKASMNSVLSRSWPVHFDEDNSLVTQTLKQSFPDTLAAEGLVHWDIDLGKKSRRSAPNSNRDDRLQRVSWTPSRWKQTAFKGQELQPSPGQKPAKTISQDDTR